MEKMKYLLSDERVKREIEKYKWIESEKKGYDIGYEAAADAWLLLYGFDWVKNNVQSGAAAIPQPDASLADAACTHSQDSMPTLRAAGKRSKIKNSLPKSCVA